MNWWPLSRAERVLAGAVLTRRHLLKAGLVLGVGLALPRAARTLVQVPDDLTVAIVTDDPTIPEQVVRSAFIADLTALLKTAYGPSIEQQQHLATSLYRRFPGPRVCVLGGAR